MSDTTFSATMSAKKMKTIVSALAKSIKSVRLDITPEMFVIHALDPSHVLLAHLELPREIWEDFECEEPLNVVVNLDELDKYMARATAKGFVKLSLSKKESKIRVQMWSTEGRKKSYNIPLSRLTMDEAPPIPEDMILNAEVRVNGIIFTELVKDAKVVSPHVTLEATTKGEFLVRASEVGGAELISEYGTESDEVIEDIVIITEKDVKATYTLQYLEDMTGFVQIMESILLQFSADKPIKITFELEDGGVMIFILAPRLEPDFS